MLGQRGTFGTVLHSLAEKNEKIFALSADLTRTSGLERFSHDYPERFLNVGIAEENMIGFSSALADSGMIPFATTFSNFAALRANEFVRHFMAYMNCNVKLVGLSSGFAMELFGNTHYGLEDVAVLRAMPNLTILSPADGLSVAKCVELCAQRNGPVYLRLSGKANQTIVYQQDFAFSVGKGIVLRQGTDALIYATGSMVSAALEASEQLERDSIHVAVVDMHTLKPLDEQLVRENKCYPLIITIEEHSRIGGLGSAISEVLSECEFNGKHIRLGTADEYYKAGSYEYMLQQHGLTADNIVNTIEKELKESKS